MKTEALSWRGLTDSTFWVDYPQVIAPSGVGRNRQWEAYDDGRLVAMRPSFAEAMAAMPGVSDWTKVSLEKVLANHYFFGPTTEFTEPAFIWVPTWAAYMLKESGYTGGGCMIALVIDPTLAESLALDREGAEAPEDLHVTLVYLPEKPGDPEVLYAAVERVAERFGPIEGVLGGVGRFCNEDSHALYLSVDVPGLNKLQVALEEECSLAGIGLSDEHGFSPHLTLTYLDSDEESPLTTIEKIPVVFKDVYVCIGPDHTAFDLLG